jgi:hypothetical protein
MESLAQAPSNIFHEFIGMSPYKYDMFRDPRSLHLPFWWQTPDTFFKPSISHRRHH